MSFELSPLECLGEVAPEFGATLSSATSPATAVISVPRAGGDRHDFELSLSVVSSAITVREAPPPRLPSFCPDRHINFDGSFCLGWGPTSPPIVVDNDSARAWWTAVVRFLQLQLTARERGVWANTINDWAHGEAADHQALAEAAADKLGPRFRADLSAGKFSVVREAHSRVARLELRRSGAHVGRIVLARPARLKDRKVLCPCDGPSESNVGECHDHADQLIAFTLELWRWQRAEAKFLREFVKRGASCCGTLSECKLRDAIALENSSKSKWEQHARRHRPRRRPRL